MEHANPYGGTASMLKGWQRQDRYTRDGPFLVLSGGDMWTGPALSTWFRGESMVDVMNAWAIPLRQLAIMISISGWMPYGNAQLRRISLY